MKNKVTFIFVLGLLIVNPFIGRCQKVNWKIYPSLGIDAGGAIPIPLSDKPGGVNGTPKLTPSLGIGINYTYNNWGIILETSYHTLVFSAKGPVTSQPFYFDNQTDLLYFTGDTETDVELRFIELALLMNYQIGKKWKIMLGPYFSDILKGNFYTAGLNGVLSPDKNITDNANLPGVANTHYNFDKYLDDFDYGFALGYEYMIMDKFFVWSTFYMGINSIFINSFNNIDYELYQIRLNVGFSYTLFGNKKI